MMSETPNRAAADLLSLDLLAPATREAILEAPAPALVLDPQGHVLFAAHAMARRLGFPDGAALIHAGLPRLAPGTLRLLALAAAPPEAARTERLRFAVGQQAAILPFSIAPLALNAGGQGIIAFLSDTAVTLPGTTDTASPEPAPPAQVRADDAPPETVAAPQPPVAASPAPRPSRFVFSLSRDGAIETLSPAFHEALGGEPDMFLGQSIAHVAGALEPAAGLAIENAIDAGTTWGGIRLNWPLPNGQALVPIILSAMPLHGAEGLKGFSGFGRILHDESIALKGPERMAVTAPAPAAPMAAVETPEPPLVPSLPPTAEAPTACAPEDLERALQAFSEDDAEAIVLPAGAQSPVPPAPVAADPAPAALVAAPVVTPPRAEPPAPAATIPAAQPPVEIEADNVVSLRPGALDLPQGLPPHLARPGLSMSERNAFREIARALGAKFEAEETDAPVAGAPAQPPAPQASAQDDLFNLVQLDAEPGPAAPNAAPVTAPPAAAETVRGRALGPDEDGEEEGEEEVSLVDALPIGVLVLRGEEPLFANKTLLDLAGYPSFTGFVAAGGAQALFRKGTLPRESEQGFETVVLTTRRGEMIPVDAHLQIVDWDGAPASLIAFRRAVELEQGRALKSVAQDLKRVRAETAELRAVLDTATDGVLTLDETGAILSLNHAAEALFGLHQNEVAGSSFVQLLHNESHASVLDYFEGLKANGVRSVLNDGREVAGREKKGGRIPLFLTFGRISDEEPRRFCAVLRDLTAWKRAETELTEARKSAETASAKKSDFLAKVGHEIRTPMNAIIGFAEVMQEERLGPIGNAKYKEYLGDIRTSGLHVVSLVNDLLDLSKIEAGRMELNFNATDINAVVTGCVGLIQPQATQHRVLVRSQLASKLPLVVADERSIRQILLNLLANATRFTPAGGQVLVATVLQESGEAIIRIRDTGVGMTPTEIEQALESYRQVGTKRENGGTGLGLPLSKALAEANRANFSIRSAPGEGTTVEISFPPTRVLAE